MAKNNNLTDFVTDLADAIRAKCKTTGAINPQDFSAFVGGMPFFKFSQTLDVTSKSTVDKAFLITTENSYQKGVVYLTNDNGETVIPDGAATILLREGSSQNIVLMLSDTDSRYNLSGFPYDSNAVYVSFFTDEEGSGQSLIDAGWHIKVDIYDLYMGNPNGENTPIDLNNAHGGGTI